MGREALNLGPEDLKRERGPAPGTSRPRRKGTRGTGWQLHREPPGREGPAPPVRWRLDQHQGRNPLLLPTCPECFGDHELEPPESCVETVISSGRRAQAFPG